MFPYGFVFFNLTFCVLIFIHQLILGYEDISSIPSIAIGLLIMGILINLGIRNYKKKINTVFEKVLAIAINIGVLPILFVNVYSSKFLIYNEYMNEEGMIFVIPLIYTPMLSMSSFILLYPYFWLRSL